MAIAAALEQGPGTRRVIAERACVGLDSAMYVLDNMVRAGHAAKVDAVRVAGVKRPVPVYGLPASQKRLDAVAGAVGVWWLDAMTGQLSS